MVGARYLMAQAKVMERCWEMVVVTGDVASS